MKKNVLFGYLNVFLFFSVCICSLITLLLALTMAPNAKDGTFIQDVYYKCRVVGISVFSCETNEQLKKNYLELSNAHKKT